MHLIVEIKGYRREYANEKKATMEAYSVHDVNNLRTFGRSAFAEFTGLYQIETHFQTKVHGRGPMQPRSPRAVAVLVLATTTAPAGVVATGLALASHGLAGSGQIGEFEHCVHQICNRLVG